MNHMNTGEQGVATKGTKTHKENEVGMGGGNERERWLR